jgi:DNA-binding CsgD family transcriptional regulator
VYSVQIQELIAQRLVRAGLNDADREELTQIICEGLLFMSDPPTDQEGCAKATNDISGKKIAGFRRQGFRRAKVDAGLTDEADNHASQDAREHANGHHAQRIAVVQEALTDGTLTDRDAQMLALKREGLTDAQIAEKLGIAKQTVSNRIAIVRTRMRDKWAKRMATLTALTLTVVILIIVGWRKREEVARLFHLESPAPAPTAPAPTRPQPEPSIPVALQEAGKLRSEAVDSCGKGDFATCSDRLEAAAKLDPAGDRDPGVRSLRDSVEDHIRSKKEQFNSAKPGSPR